MSDASVTNELAIRVMCLRPGPTRFMKDGRCWIPRWRFAPLTRLVDALSLLRHAGGNLTIVRGAGSAFFAEVTLHGRIGSGNADTEARAITYALCEVLEIRVKRGDQK